MQSLVRTHASDECWHQHLPDLDFETIGGPQVGMLPACHVHLTLQRGGMYASCVQDLYIARAQGELVLEEELYNVLISIYRSPAVLFELTRRKIKQA